MQGNNKSNTSYCYRCSAKRESTVLSTTPEDKATGPTSLWAGKPCLPLQDAEIPVINPAVFSQKQIHRSGLSSFTETLGKGAGERPNNTVTQYRQQPGALRAMSTGTETSLQVNAGSVCDFGESQQRQGGWSRRLLSSLMLQMAEPPRWEVVNMGRASGWPSLLGAVCKCSRVKACLIFVFF